VAEHPNVGLIRKVYDALVNGNYLAALTELFREDVVWYLPGTHPLSGEHRGRDAVFAAMRRFEQLSAGTIRIDVHDVLANDEHAVALLRATGTRSGTRHDSLEVDIYHITGGKVTELWSFAENQRLTDAFWS
jgi:ketosteroid isomerase-like protein